MSVREVHTLDLKGLPCPMPIIRTAKAIKEVAAGERLEVLATDPGSVADFEAWCRATNNVLIERTAGDGVFRFVIEKG